MEQPKPGISSGHHRYALRIMTVAMIALFWSVWTLPGCVHEPFDPLTPDPVDTTGQPIDTTGTDTMGIPCDPNVVYFEFDILPILKSNCAKSGCHDAASHQDGIVLDNYANVMGSDVIDPYDLDDSDLYEVITENDPDKRMPQPPNARLTPDQIALIAKWIQQGANNLDCDPDAGACDTTSVTYSGVIAPLLTTYCVGCHSGGAPSGNITLNVYSGVQTVALNGRLMGAVTWAPGFQQMPRGSAKLSECNIAKIKAWIDDGAPNN